MLGIERMLHVARPGGWVLLRHARNEGVAGQFRNGAAGRGTGDVGKGRKAAEVGQNPSSTIL